MKDIVVPKWGLTMEEAELTKWHVAAGDQVVEGQPVAELDADKVSGDAESPASGVITELVAEVGAVLAPGEVIARMRER